MGEGLIRVTVEVYECILVCQYPVPSNKIVVDAILFHYSRTFRITFTVEFIWLFQGNSDRSFTRQHKSGTLVKSCSGNSPQNGILKYDGTSNGISHAVQSDDIQGHAALRLSNSWGKEKVMKSYKYLYSEVQELFLIDKTPLAKHSSYESLIRTLRFYRNFLSDLFSTIFCFGRQALF